MKLSLTDNKYLKWFYPLFFVVCYMQARGLLPWKLPGEGIIIWPFRLFVIYIGIKALLANNNKCPSLLLYLVYSLASIILLISYGLPLSIYFMTLPFYVSPILMAYVGMDARDLSSNFYKYTYRSIIVMLVVGVYLYAVKPGWYQAAMVNRWESNWFYEGLTIDFATLAETMRFSSFMLTSYATQYFGLFAMAYSLTELLKSKTSKEGTLYSLLSVFVFVILILSMQRASIVSATAMIFLFILYDIRYHRHKKTKMLQILFGVGILVFFTYMAATGLGTMIIDRISSLGNAYSVRSGMTTNMLEEFNSMIFGTGIGTGGVRAARAGLKAVSDANYTKILVEQGIVGCVFFFSFIIQTCHRIVKYFKYYALEGAFLLSILIAMIGSNTLDFSLYIIPFWYAMGRVWNKEYLQNQIINKDHI